MMLKVLSSVVAESEKRTFCCYKFNNYNLFTVNVKNILKRSVVALLSCCSRAIAVQVCLRINPGGIKAFSYESLSCSLKSFDLLQFKLYIQNYLKTSVSTGN